MKKTKPTNKIQKKALKKPLKRHQKSIDIEDIDSNLDAVRFKEKKVYKNYFKKKTPVDLDFLEDFAKIGK